MLRDAKLQQVMSLWYIPLCSTVSVFFLNQLSQY